MAPAPKKKQPNTQADTVAPERLTVMRPIVFNRTANAAPDPKLAQQRAQAQAATQALVAAFSASSEDRGNGIDLEAVAKAIKTGANINTPVNALGQTALHVAVNENDHILAAQLLRAGANTRARDHEGLTPLIRSLREGDEAMSGMLARAEEKPEAQVAAGRHAIHDAAAEGHVEALEALIARGVSPTIKDVDGDSPLMEALKNEKSDAAIALAYAGGIQQNLSRQYRATIAATVGSDRPAYELWDFLKAVLPAQQPPALMPQPAALPQKRGLREDELFTLLRGRDANSIAQLMKKRPDMAARNEAGDTPLIVALRAQFTRAAEMFVTKSDVNATGKYGQTALHAAAACNSYDGTGMVRRLIDLGADINARDARGHTPLMAAAMAGSEPNVLLLLERGADAGLKDKLGLTARQHAAFSGAGDAEAELGRAENAQKKPRKAPAAKTAFKAAAKLPVKTAAKLPVKAAAKLPVKSSAKKTKARKPLQRQSGARYR